mmetsp:Transcript_29473/g.70989  ORF Transcript_29473/g.70989 Transcript_29473/m.70989 type:complete len:224 (-) Transcript_29473:4167-4838(-)
MHLTLIFLSPFVLSTMMPFLSSVCSVKRSSKSSLCPTSIGPLSGSLFDWISTPTTLFMSLNMRSNSTRGRLPHDTTSFPELFDALASITKFLKTTVFGFPLNSPWTEAKEPLLPLDVSPTLSVPPSRVTEAFLVSTVASTEFPAASCSPTCISTILEMLGKLGNCCSSRPAPPKVSQFRTAWLGTPLTLICMQNGDPPTTLTLAVKFLMSTPLSLSRCDTVSS